MSWTVSNGFEFFANRLLHYIFKQTRITTDNILNNNDNVKSLH